jgi:hypothetical protein
MMDELEVVRKRAVAALGVIALKIFASMKKITKDLPLALCPPTDF